MFLKYLKSGGFYRKKMGLPKVSAALSSGFLAFQPSRPPLSDDTTKWRRPRTPDCTAFNSIQLKNKASDPSDDACSSADVHDKMAASGKAGKVWSSYALTNMCESFALDWLCFCLLPEISDVIAAIISVVLRKTVLGCTGCVSCLGGGSPFLEKLNFNTISKFKGILHSDLVLLILFLEFLKN